MITPAHIFQVSGISCDGCAARISRAISREDASARVAVDQALQQVTVDSAVLSEAAVTEILDNTGFPVQLRF